MRVFSTRNKEYGIAATAAVLKGISEDGGLFVPESFPKINLEEICSLTKEGYQSLAAEIFSLFFEIDKTELKKLAVDAYASFDCDEVVPIATLDNAKIIELWHGPTLAFKDMALQVLPRLMSKSLEMQSEIKNIMILTATSGDTGKAALEGFCDVDRTGIVVFYPNEGVSKMQKLQMATQGGKNTCVFSVDGNFDDAQTGVKELFANKEFSDEMLKEGYSLSSANSINIGRLIPQVAYYIYAYAKLVNEEQIKAGDAVNICVPTGNFGNILAAYYAKQMGMPFDKLICASNKNNVLTDFFETGVYNANREFFKTMSPSMDILISSNLERLLFELTGRNSAEVADMMKQLKENGKYEISAQMREKLEKDFWGGFCDEEHTAKTIKYAFDEYGYLMDTHTAVAYGVYNDYVKKTGDDKVTILASTANPYKFTSDVLCALTGKREDDDAFKAADMLSEYTKTAVPQKIAELKDKPVIHKTNLKKEDMGKGVLSFVRGEK